MIAYIIATKCQYCGEFRPCSEITEMPGGIAICFSCEQRHIEALAALSSGTFTGECSECGRTAEQIRSPNGAMAVHYENGRYRAMCMQCDATYVPRRGDLYRDTEFGWQQKLK